MTIVIFANGDIEDLNHDVKRWLSPEDTVIAADGGACFVLDLGLVPQHIIGDMDSLGDELAGELQARGAVLHRYAPEKDETDLELALLWAVAQSPSRIVILGALGGRPDQELANYLLLSHPALKTCDVVLAGGQWEIRLLRGGQTLALDAQSGDTVSLLPFGGTAGGITTRGLYYPLLGESLFIGPARGVSNVVESMPVSIRLEEGMLLVMLARGDLQR